MADLASLDAVRHLGDISCVSPGSNLISYITTVVTQSAQRNGYDASAHGNSVPSVRLGTVNMSTRAFTQSADACSATAVEATVGSVTSWRFVPGSQAASAKAVSSKVGEAEFSVGSFIGTVDTTKSALLNAVIPPMLGGPAGSITAGGWSGLMSSGVSLSALQTELVNEGLDVGTTDKLMNTSISSNKFMLATASALGKQGGNNAAAITALNALAAGAGGSSQFQLGKVVDISQGDETSALAASMNAFQLVTTAAEVANGNNFINISNLAVTLPNGVTNISVSLQAISPPAIKFGPIGVTAHNGQVNLTVTPTLNKTVTVAGLVGATVNGTLPIAMTAGGADGTLTDVRCVGQPNQGITIDAVPKAATVTGSGTLALKANVLGLATTIANVGVSSSQQTAGSDTSLTFGYTSEFVPPIGTGTTKRAGSSTVGLSGSSYSTTNVQLLSGLVSSNAAANGVLGALDPVVTALDSTVISPLAQVLGLSIGGADIGAMNMDCNAVQLIS
ncbi:MAG: hypothetical protein JO086_03720 [Acidimicrobiia bacterium]|nr:hypothetical protein [Acidimicrobiia bacterium]